MDIKDMRLGDVWELLRVIGPSKTSHSWQVGQKVFIRTLSYHYIGRVAAVTDTDVVLDEASWVADSGRWNHALTTGELSEVEPYPGSVVVHRGVIVDHCRWDHDLPREVK